MDRKVCPAFKDRRVNKVCRAFRVSKAYLVKLDPWALKGQEGPQVLLGLQVQPVLLALPVRKVLLVPRVRKVLPEQPT